MEKKISILKEIRNWVIMILITFAASVIFSTEVYAKVVVQYRSMENTLFENQHIIMDRISYKFSKPKAGDIIIFLENEERGSLWDELKHTAGNMLGFMVKDSKERLVKRVIGVSGDVIDIRDGYVYVNDIRLEEPYVKGVTEQKEMDLPITVGDNQLFVMGDNREVSIDSRSFGLISCDQVEGKVVFRVYPFNTIGKIK